ncbi:MAG TPA: hypothetical protein VGF34_03235 [Stellaceae bacterium]
MTEHAHRLHPSDSWPALDGMMEPRSAAHQDKRRFRVVEIHPALWLGPAAPGARKVECLPGSLIERLIVDAAAQSYDAVGIAGGERPLGAGLRAALALAKRLGLATTLLTTLAPLTRRRLDRLAGVLDAVAVTLYGAPPTHDRVHGKTGAFRTMAARLAALRAATIPFGFVFTVTDSNLDELAWVKRFALDEGARWLHIRLLEPGRPVMDFGERCSIRSSLACRGPIHTRPSRLENAAHADHPHARLADLIAPLVVEADGTAVPLQHGFPRRYALGNLRCARLPVLAARWRSGGGYAGFREYCEEVLRAAPSQPAFDWLAAVSSWPAPPTAPSVDPTRTRTL